MEEREMIKVCEQLADFRKWIARSDEACDGGWSKRR
jgi:hypothetical protein